MGGIFMLVVPSAWEYHGDPKDYWRFSREQMGQIFGDCEMLILIEADEGGGHSLVYMKARKPPGGFQERPLEGIEVGRV